MLRRESFWCSPRSAKTAAWWDRRVSGRQEQPWAKEPVTRAVSGFGGRWGGKPVLVGGRWRPVRGTWALRAWVCPDLGRGFLGLPVYLLSVNLLCSVAEPPTHTPDLAFLPLLATV